MLKIVVVAFVALGTEVWTIPMSNMAFEKQYPFVVSIQYNNKVNSNYSQCTGIVLSKTWVSTSCVCLSQLNEGRSDGIPWIRNFRIIVATVINNPERCRLNFADRIVTHAKCNIKDNTFDFAVMKMAREFTFKNLNPGSLSIIPVSSEDINVIRLGTQEILQRKPICKIVGWVGKRSMVGSANLLQLAVQILPLEECNFDERKALRSESLICGQAIRETPCEGFLGAPLVCGTNVWATVCATNKCGSKLAENSFVLMSRIDMAYDFLKNFVHSQAASKQSELRIYVIRNFSFIILYLII